MAIDLMGPRFYTQQMSASRGGTKKVPTRLKKDICIDIEKILGIKLPSLMKLTKLDMEEVYGKIQIHEG